MSLFSCKWTQSKGHVIQYFRTPFVRGRAYQHPKVLPAWWTGCFMSSRSFISPRLRVGGDQCDLKMDASIWLKTWNSRVDRPQLALGLMLSAASPSSPGSPRSLRGAQIWVSRSGTTVRSRHGAVGGPHLRCVSSFLGRGNAFSFYSVIRENWIW